MNIRKVDLSKATSRRKSLRKNKPTDVSNTQAPASKLSTDASKSVESSHVAYDFVGIAG
jgi:hypothetical protein